MDITNMIIIIRKVSTFFRCHIKEEVKRLPKGFLFDSPFVLFPFVVL